MNARLKRRLLAVTGIIIVVFIVMLAVVTAGTTARSVSVAEVLDGDVAAGERVEVTGVVTDDSYSMDGTTATFAITDDSDSTAADAAEALTVTYDGAISATFGSGITAICTGVLGSDGVLEASELVTKCPSKYENSSDSLTIAELLAYGDDIVSTTVKVSGTVTSDGIAGADEAVRFTIADATETDDAADGSTEGATLDVSYDGALSDDVTAGATLVVTGSLSADGTFEAADVALGE